VRNIGSGPDVLPTARIEPVTDGEQLAGEEYLCVVGQGLDGGNRGLFAYDSKELHSSFFNYDWLRSFYSNGSFERVFDDAVFNSAFGNNVFEVAEGLVSAGAGRNCFDASLPYVENDLFCGAVNSSVTPIHRGETVFLYDARYSKREFTYALPDFDTNKETYQQNISLGAVNLLDECAKHLNKQFVDGQFYSPNKFLSTQIIYKIFERYGTHVIWKAGFGGGVDLSLSWLTDSGDEALNRSLMKEARLGIDHAILMAINKQKDTSFDINEYLGFQDKSFARTSSARFVGGTSAPSLFFSIDGFTDSLSKWLPTIHDQPNVITYEEVKPIWELLPAKYDGVAKLMAEVYEKYKSNKEEESSHELIKRAAGYYSRYSPLYDECPVMGENQFAYIGDYWDGRKDKEFTVSLDQNGLYNPKFLDMAGYKYVTITPRFNLDGTRGGTRVGMSIDYGDGKNAETSYYYDLEGSTYTNCSSTSLGVPEITIPLEEFAQFPTIRIKMMTNDRGAFFLPLAERGAKVSGLRVDLRYSKEL
ncbi:MAG: MAC/perforin domain-containing protein, partial [Candidatus Enteromonas sp.]